MNPELPGLLSFLAACVQGVTHPAPAAPTHWWHKRWLFLLLLTAALFFFQRHAILANFQLWNPDESEMLAGALKLRHYPIFWRDVDGNSHGPVNQFPLVLPALLGFRIDYTSARVLGNLMIVAMLFCLHRTIAKWASERAARFCVLPGWAFFIFNQEPEIAQYTTEIPSCLLLAAGSFFAIRLWRRRPSLSRAAVFLVGLLVGAAPFAKLQCAPLAVWILGLAALRVVRAHPLPLADRVQRFGWLLLGAVLPGAFFVGLAAWGGAFQYFCIAYLESNLVGYVLNGGAYFNSAYPKFEYLFGLSQFVWPVATAIVLALGLSAWKRLPMDWGVVLFAAGLLGAAFFTVYAPHKPFGHYFLYLIGPFLILLGATAGPVLDALTATLPPRRALAVAALALAGLVTPLAAHHFQHPAYFWAVVNQRSRSPTELVTAVQQLTVPDEFVELWGWRPGLHVYTQTLPSTRNVITFWAIVNSPRQDFYRASYMADLHAHPPVVFVDTVGPVDFFFFRHPETAKHETFPALAAYIRKNYVLAETISGARVYLRKDRIDRLPGKL